MFTLRDIMESNEFSTQQYKIPIILGIEESTNNKIIVGLE